MERIKRMEELLLGPVLAGQELDVVDEQDITVAVALAEFVHLVSPDRLDHLVHEPLAGHVGDLALAALLHHGMADRVHQVGLAEADSAIQEKRVISLPWGVCDSASGGMSEARIMPRDEGVEGELGVELS